MLLQEKKSRRYFSDSLPFAAMVAEGVIVTKDADLMRIVRVWPRDLSFAEDHDIDRTLRNLTNGFRWLGEGWTVWIDCERRLTDIGEQHFNDSAPRSAKDFESYRVDSVGSFYTSEYHITLCYSIAERKGAKSFLFDTKGEDTISADLEKFIRSTDTVVGMFEAAFEKALALDSDEALTYLHNCVSAKRHKVRCPEFPFYLDHVVADSWWQPDTITKLDGRSVVCASVHDFPQATHGGMIAALMRLPVEFRISSRFIFLSPARAKKEIKSYRQAHFQKRKGIGSYFQEAATGAQTQLEDTEATALADDAGDAISVMASGDITFGYLATTVVVIDDDYDNAKRRLSKVVKELNGQEWVVKEESFNNPFAFLGAVPGNHKYNCRQPMISTRNLAHLFPISAPWSGSPYNEHLASVTGIKAPHMVTRAGAEAFFLNLNVDDVGHTLVVGPTGAGKSILLNALALQYLRYPGTRVIFFDKDRSSQSACKNAGGAFFEIGGEREGENFLLNPFGGLSEKTQRVWLSEFLGGFLASKGVSISTKIAQELFDALGAMSESDPEFWTFQELQRLVQDADVRSGLSSFIDGEYSSLFTNQDDAIGSSVWTTFEMAAIMGMGEDITQFVLGYLFHRLAGLFDGTPTLLVLDEAWLFLDNPTFASMLRDWLKTLRKKNVYVVLATQEIADAKSTIFSTIVNACMTRILLPNSQASQPENHKLYVEMGMSENDIEAIREGQARRQYLYASPRGKQMFELCLDDRQLRILTKTLTPGSIEPKGEEL